MSAVNEELEPVLLALENYANCIEDNSCQEEYEEYELTVMREINNHLPELIDTLKEIVYNG